ncbi:MAG: ATP-binding cassette domain-containing protein, partial [Candidatus Hydrogenedentes bacterium]|nr:ATP-binding cassette domain-containing protein [Candidatus Hydrogenedentota bacterium]
GLMGENGAGKTTLMKHILGALQPKQGEVRVFGVDPTRNPPAVLSRIGYLSEDRDLPRWMRVKEALRYTQAFYPDWDESYAERLHPQPLPRGESQGGAVARPRASSAAALARRALVRVGRSRPARHSRRGRTVRRRRRAHRHLLVASAGRGRTGCRRRGDDSPGQARAPHAHG